MDETKQKFLDKMHPPRAEEQIVSDRKWMLYLFFMCNTDSKYHFSSRICHFERSEHDDDEKFCEGSLHMDFN